MSASTFTVGTVPIQVSSLGRICAVSNSHAYVVKLVVASNGSDVAGAAASVSLSGCTPGRFVYAPMTWPVTLPAAANYFLVDAESSAGDQSYDYTLMTTATVARGKGAVYGSGTQYPGVPAHDSGFRLDGRCGLHWLYPPKQLLGMGWTAPAVFSLRRL